MKVEIPDSILNFKKKIHPDVIPNLPLKELNSKLKEISNKYKEDKIIVFLVIDYEFPLQIPDNIFVLRTSIRKSLINREKEYLLPYIWNTQKNPFNPHPKTPLPIVGFCGQVNSYRKNILNNIFVNKFIVSNFILNRYFWGGIYLNKNIDKDYLIKIFRKNMKSSHFIICNRGAGNFTMRFYETLAAGRIPILVNTDMILPLEDKINWKEYIIFEPSEELVVKKIFHWWKTKNIEYIQYQCYLIYNKYFSKNNFTNYLKEVIPY